MRHALHSRQEDIKRLLAIGGVSIALVVGTSTLASATPISVSSDADKDGLSSKIEVKITKTDPYKADTDHDGIKDGEEDRDEDGVDNNDELWLGTRLNDPDSDNDGTLDGDEDKDGDGVDNEDEDDEKVDADACAAAEDDAVVEDDSDEDSDGDDLDDEDEDDFGTQPNDPDSDNDGTLDGDEDNDGNGVADGDEDDEDEDDDCDGERDKAD